MCHFILFYLFNIFSVLSWESTLAAADGVPDFCAEYRRETGGETSLTCSVNKL